VRRAPREGRGADVGVGRGRLVLKWWETVRARSGRGGGGK
jgi:hypothetical protein